MKRRRCTACRALVETGVIRVYCDGTHLDYRPGYQPRGLPSAFVCGTCDIPATESDDISDRSWIRDANENDEADALGLLA